MLQRERSRGDSKVLPERNRPGKTSMAQRILNYTHMKHRITLTNEEISMLAHILRQLADHTSGDDRPDHGLNNLRSYRKCSPETKGRLYMLNGKMNRLWRRYRK